MTATTEQRIPWLRGERRSAGAAGAVAARDQPQPPRRPLPAPLPRHRKVAVLAAALGLLVGAVVVFLGPLADRCGPVGDVKRCADPNPVPVMTSQKPWTAAFEAVAPAPAGVAAPAISPVITPRVLAPEVLTPQVLAPDVLAPTRTASVPAATQKLKAARGPARAKVSTPVRRTAEESRTSARTSTEDESGETASDSDDE